MRTRTRLIAAGAAVALLTGASGAAAASSGASPSTTPTAATSSPSAGSGKDGGKRDITFEQIAASLHVTVDQLMKALGVAKMAIGETGDGNPLAPSVVSAFAKALGITDAQARPVLQEVFKGQAGGKTPSGNPDAQFTHALARILGISDAKAADTVRALQQISRPGQGIDPNSAAFKAIAAGLHITQQRLVDAITQAKQEISGSQPTASPSGKS